MYWKRNQEPYVSTPWFRKNECRNGTFHSVTNRSPSVMWYICNPVIIGFPFHPPSNNDSETELLLVNAHKLSLVPWLLITYITSLATSFMWLSPSAFWGESPTHDSFPEFLSLPLLGVPLSNPASMLPCNIDWFSLIFALKMNILSLSHPKTSPLVKSIVKGTVSTLKMTYSLNQIKMG